MDGSEPLVPLTSSSSPYQLMAGWEQQDRSPIRRGVEHSVPTYPQQLTSNPTQPVRSPSLFLCSSLDQSFPQKLFNFSFSRRQQSHVHRQVNSQALGREGPCQPRLAQDLPHVFVCLVSFSPYGFSAYLKNASTDKGVPMFIDTLIMITWALVTCACSTRIGSIPERGSEHTLTENSKSFPMLWMENSNSAYSNLYASFAEAHILNDPGAFISKDSMGNSEVLQRGDLQMTSAGTGIRHSEKCHGPKQVHFLQIWAQPNESNLSPKYYTRSVFPYSPTQSPHSILSGHKLTGPRFLSV